MQVMKRAMWAAVRWMSYNLIVAILIIPINLIRHQPILNGLWHDWQVADWPLRGQLFGIFILILVGGWLVLSLFFGIIYGVKQWLANQDQPV